MKMLIKSSLLIILLNGFAFSCASRPIYIKKAPPVLRVEVKTVKPYKNALWISGHWQWKKNKHVWVSGYWVRPRHGYVWVAGKWVKTPRGWIWKSGHWKRI